MFRLLTAPLACVLLVTCLSIFPSPAFVMADVTYLLEAKTIAPRYASDWSLQFVDAGEPNGLCTEAEIVPGSFTGVWLKVVKGGPLEFFTTIVHLPSSQIWPFENGYGANCFEVKTPDGFDFTDWPVEGLWAFTLTPPFQAPSAVPIPPTVLLLGSGLLGLTGWRRFRKS